MTTQSSTRLRWSWKATAFAFLVSVSPALFQMMTDHRDLLTAAAASDGLTIAPASLVTAVCFYTSWRISVAASPTWLVAGTALLGVHSVSLAALQVTNPHLTAERHTWMALADLVLLASVLALRAAGRTTVMQRYPTAIGATVGLVIGLLRVTAASRFAPLHPALPDRLLVAVVGVSLAATIALLVLRAAPVALVVRERLVVALLLLTAGHTVTAIDGIGQHALNTFVSLGCSVVAAVAFFGAAVGMLRRTLVEESGVTTTLRTRLEVVEQDERRHRARIHEIESMMAGIVSASELLRQRHDIPSERRAHLEEMIHEELGRLERLLRAQHEARRVAAEIPRPRSAGETVTVPVSPTAPTTITGSPAVPSGLSGLSVPSGPATVDLDRTIGHLALAHEAKGTTVTWRPGGHRVNGHADDITEVLNILLDNAARHGDATASVSVCEAPHVVEILVSDHGPGIAPEIRDQLFQWGARGPGSPGQGIGLHIAQDLMRKSGGYLRLQDSGPSGSGATFVVGLPRAGVPAGREVGDGILA